MKAAAFEYHRPDTVAEAAQILGEFGDSAKILAGGQSLVPMLAMRLTFFEHLIDISRIDELKNIELRGDELWVAAGTPHALVGMDDEVAESVPLLTLSTPYIGHFQIRARGTLGGAIAHAEPRRRVRRGRARARRDDGGDVVTGATRDPGGGVLHRPVGDVVGARRDPHRRAISIVGRPVRLRRRGIRQAPRRFRHRGCDGRTGARRRRPGGAVRFGLLGLGSTPLRGSAAEDGVVGRPPMPLPQKRWAGSR